MAHQRRLSVADGQKQAHSLSLKVLRKVLTLPPAFGSAYVGETFSCTLCANNELPSTDAGTLISAVRITAEIQNPSQTIPLELSPADDDSTRTSLKPGESHQKIVQYDLKEEGNHILAVTVTYTETKMAPKSGSLGENQAASGRVRTFRKLYQFIAQQQIAVRTKSAEMPPLIVEDASTHPPSKLRFARFALEAQLENMGENAVKLEAVALDTKPPFRPVSLNRDIPSSGPGDGSSPVLNPHDVMQVAFLLEEQQDSGGESADHAQASAKNLSKIPQSQLSIRWRSSMGDGGFLITGWLTARRR
ncbi:MAG: hypothetical protein M1819_006574 [Sarea resinae]|nr:MAG: hypothetical protein M1819_006574 [Sarea resinae]